MLLAIEAPWPVIAASTLLAGIGIELFSVFWDTSLQAHVPNEVLSRVSAWDAIGSLVLIPAGYAIVGPLADAIGIDETLWLCAGIVLVAITAQLLSRQVRELPRLPPEPEPRLAALCFGPRWIARPGVAGRLSLPLRRARSRSAASPSSAPRRRPPARC